MIKEYNSTRLVFDEKDADLLNKYNWYFDKSINYLRSRHLGKVVYFHRLKTNCPKNMQVDHINCYTIDNRDSNLRIVTKKQNSINVKKWTKTSSLYKGVYYQSINKNWATNIFCDGIKYVCGSYHEEIDAAIAVDKKYKEIVGDGAWLNFPFNKEESTCYVGGNFDLFHQGHLNLIKNAKKIAARVIVSLNTDEFSIEYKKVKPYQNLETRMEILKSIRGVDDVIVNIGGRDSTIAISTIKPQYILHGDDWVGDDLKKQMMIDDAFLAINNIRMIYSRHTPNISSTELRRIK